MGFWSGLTSSLGSAVHKAESVLSGAEHSVVSSVSSAVSSVANVAKSAVSSFSSGVTTVGHDITNVVHTYGPEVENYIVKNVVPTVQKYAGDADYYAIKYLSPFGSFAGDDTKNLWEKGDYLSAIGSYSSSNVTKNLGKDIGGATQGVLSGFNDYIKSFFGNFDTTQILELAALGIGGIFVAYLAFRIAFKFI